MQTIKFRILIVIKILKVVLTVYVVTTTFLQSQSPKVRVTLLIGNSSQSKRYKNASVQFELMGKIERELKY